MKPARPVGPDDLCLNPVPRTTGMRGTGQGCTAAGKCQISAKREGICPRPHDLTLIQTAGNRIGQPVVERCDNKIGRFAHNAPKIIRRGRRLIFGSLFHSSLTRSERFGCATPGCLDVGTTCGVTPVALRKPLTSTAVAPRMMKRGEVLSPPSVQTL